MPGSLPNPRLIDRLRTEACGQEEMTGVYRMLSEKEPVKCGFEKRRIVNLLIPGRCLNRGLVPAPRACFVPGHLGRDIGLMGDNRILIIIPGTGIRDIIPGP